MNAKCSTVAVTRSVSTSSAATVAHATVVMPLKTAKHVKVSFPGPLSVLQLVLGDLGLYVGELGCAEQSPPTSQPQLGSCWGWDGTGCSRQY